MRAAHLLHKAFLPPPSAFLGLRTALPQSQCCHISVRATPRMALPTADTLRKASFMSCVGHARTILQASDQPTDEMVELLEAMLETSNGARGLLVTLLADGGVKMDDRVVQVIADGGEETMMLMTKNVVMSSCRMLDWERKGDQEQKEASEMTRARAIKVCKEILESGAKADKFAELMREMRASMDGSGGIFDDFVKKWEYDEEQRAAAVRAIDVVMGEKN